MQPDISVVIPVRNGAATLAEQLAALAAAGKLVDGFEVIVADNGSTDSTIDVARSFTDRLPLRIITVTRPGANAARNAAVKASTGRFLAFCDADDVVNTHWMARMREALGAGSDLVVGYLDYRDLNGPDTLKWRGARGAGPSVHLGFLPAGHLCNLAVTRSLFDELNGFDESFVGGGDDVDFCWRAQLAGARFQYLPDAVVNYRFRPSLRAMARQEAGYGAAEAQLYRKFASHGVRRRSVKALGEDAWWLVSRLPFTLREDRRGAWIRRASRQCGRFRGAVRTRTWWW